METRGRRSTYKAHSRIATWFKAGFHLQAPGIATIINVFLSIALSECTSSLPPTLLSAGWTFICMCISIHHTQMQRSTNAQRHIRWNIIVKTSVVHRSTPPFTVLAVPNTHSPRFWARIIISSSGCGNIFHWSYGDCANPCLFLWLARNPAQVLWNEARASPVTLIDGSPSREGNTGGWLESSQTLRVVETVPCCWCCLK